MYSIALPYSCCFQVSTYEIGSHLQTQKSGRNRLSASHIFSPETINGPPGPGGLYAGGELLLILCIFRIPLPPFCDVRNVRNVRTEGQDMFCSTATRSGRNKTSWSGLCPDTQEQGRLHPRTQLTRHAQTRFYDTGQDAAWSEAKNPQKRAQAVLRRGVIHRCWLGRTLRYGF